jgi:hypothetical protein
MKTTLYRLKSNYEEAVTIPESLADGANKLIEDSVKANDANDLTSRIQKYDKLKNYPIFSDALKFNVCFDKNFGEGPDLLRKGDILYLRYVLYNMYDMVKESKKAEHNEEEHNELLNIMLPIMNIIRSLEDIGVKDRGMR